MSSIGQGLLVCFDDSAVCAGVGNGGVQINQVKAGAGSCLGQEITSVPILRAPKDEVRDFKGELDVTSTPLSFDA